MLLDTSLGRSAWCRSPGSIARRIVSFVREGETIGVGDRFGLIRFGSRVDVYLPEAVRVMVGHRRHRHRGRDRAGRCPRHRGPRSFKAG